MSKRVNPLIPLFVTVSVASIVIGLVLGDADPAVQALTAGAVILAADLYFFRESEL